jgi:hypothetical protein
LTGQQNRDINLIIVVDNKVVISNISSFSLNAKGDTSTFKANFQPGRLILNDTAFKKIIKEEKRSILIKFDFLKYSKNKILNYRYEIELGSEVLRESYVILSIYNISRYSQKNFLRKYQKDFIFELDSPSYTTRSMR